jgi:hypothetical protein
MVSTKRYLIKTIDSKGMLEDPEDFYGDRVFSKYGYETEEEVWEAIGHHMNRTGRTYGDSYVVLQQFTVQK